MQEQWPRHLQNNNGHGIYETAMAAASTIQQSTTAAASKIQQSTTAAAMRQQQPRHLRNIVSRGFNTTATAPRDDCHGSYTATSVTHGMDNHASYAPSLSTDQQVIVRWFITTQQSTTTSSRHRLPMSSALAPMQQRTTAAAST
jgi:hypothetical protein